MKVKVGDRVRVVDNLISKESGVVTEAIRRHIKVSWGGRIGVYSDTHNVVPADNKFEFWWRTRVYRFMKVWNKLMWRIYGH